MLSLMSINDVGYNIVNKLCDCYDCCNSVVKFHMKLLSSYTAERFHMYACLHMQITLYTNFMHISTGTFAKDTTTTRRMAIHASYFYAQI